MKNELIALLITVAMVTVFTVGGAVAKIDAIGGSVEGSIHAMHMAQADAASLSEHGGKSKTSNCCHVDCNCCVTQASPIVVIQSNSWAGSDGVSKLETLTLPKPTLKGIRRPPKFT